MVYMIIDMDLKDEKGSAPVVGYGYLLGDTQTTFPQYVEDYMKTYLESLAP